MKKWIQLHQRLFRTIVFLAFIVLMLVRSFVLYETNAAGNPDYSALTRSFLDSLMATILVTVFVSTAIMWIRSPLDKGTSEIFIQPFEIDELLRKGARNTREWVYLGHTARYVRSQIFPLLNRDSLSKNEPKRLRAIFLNPESKELCDFYARYRNDSRSISFSQERWSQEQVRADLVASVLCLIELHQGNSMLEVQGGFINYVSLFRIDICSNIALVTQEDNQEPAICYESSSHFYKCYRREVDLVWRQSTQLSISSVKTKLNLNNAEAIRSCLNEAGLNTQLFENEFLESTGQLAKDKRSPYVHK